MTSHLRSIVEIALAELPKTPARVLDIGCNDGTLLNCYPSKVERFGVDPSTIAGQLSIEATIVNSTFPSEEAAKALGGKLFDVVTSIAMFYDLEAPIKFAQEIKKILSPAGLWVLEVSYLPLMLIQNSFDTICHEHLEYYSLSVLEFIMSAAGLRVFRADLNDSNGGSIRCWVAHNDDFNHGTKKDRECIAKLRRLEFEMELETDTPYVQFQHRIISLREQTRSLINRLRTEKNTIHVYGASTKGNVLLQWYGLDVATIPYAADRNPDKHGARTLGTNIQIIDENTSRQMRPDYYLVLPWHFRDEFIEREQEMIASGTRMIFPLPVLEVIGPENIGQLLAQPKPSRSAIARFLDLAW